MEKFLGGSLHEFLEKKNAEETGINSWRNFCEIPEGAPKIISESLQDFKKDGELIETIPSQFREFSQGISE